MKRLLMLALCLGAAFTAPGRTNPRAPGPAASQVIAIVGGTLVDGSGRALVADSVVIIAGDRIRAAGGSARVKIPEGARLVDARGLVVAPGFIDTHNHSQSGLDTDPAAVTQVSQGITTAAFGQDGSSALPVGEYLARREKSPVAINVLSFVGHATVRSRVMGQETKRASTPAETEEMVRLVEQAMREGAFGLSSGLEYEVGKPATTGEVIALARAAGRRGGIYISHIRDEGNLVMEALAEIIRIGREARLPVQISHIKLGSVAVWGKGLEVVALVNGARRAGLDITADCYPYDAWHSTIRVLVPSGRHEDPGEVARGLADMGGAQNITIVSCEAHPGYEFKTLDAIARAEGRTPVEVYMRVVNDGGARVVGRSMKEEDIRVFYRQPWVMVGSDGGIQMRHPRSAGTYPRVLGRYVRERRWLSLQEAVRKMTSLPAWRLGLTDRGLVRPGMRADLVLFDPRRVIDRSTFREPHLIAEGVHTVFVNGVEVWRDGAATGRLPGRVLRHMRSS
jgi:N-acyl-D-amino-acid deacylase